MATPPPAPSDVETQLEAALSVELIAGAQRWLEEPVKVVTKSDNILFVPEGAWAVVPRDSTKVSWIGTDDATTCHCVAFVTSTLVAVAHLNSPNAAPKMFKDVLEAMGNPDHVDVFIGGGMGGGGCPKGPTDLSLATTLATVSCMKEAKTTFAIKLCCVGHLNTTAKDGNPACRGLCVELATANVLRAEYEDDARGREFLMRYGSGHLSRPMRGILKGYDHRLDCFLVPAPDADRCAQALGYLGRVAALSNEELLSHSTSPGFEKARFADDQRGSALNNMDIARKIIDNQEAEYALTPDGLYLLVPRLAPSS